MSDFFKSKGFKAIIAVFVVLFGILLGSVLRNGVSGTVDGFVGIIVTPIRSVCTYVGDFFEDIGNNFESRESLQKRIDELEEQNAELIKNTVELNEYRRENEQLRQLVKLQEANEDMEFAFASVISHSSDMWTSTLGLDKGSLDGVRVNDPVITKDSYLVGYVSKVGTTWCTVTTILDPGTNVGVRLSSSREVGVTECNVELADKGVIRVAYLPKDSAVARGELVITSGLSGYYPAGLLVGTVQTLALSDDSLSTGGEVVPLAQINSIKDVFVITAFAGQGDEVE